MKNADKSDIGQDKIKGSGKKNELDGPSRNNGNATQEREEATQIRRVEGSLVES